MFVGGRPSVPWQIDHSIEFCQPIRRRGEQSWIWFAAMEMAMEAMAGGTTWIIGGTLRIRHLRTNYDVDDVAVRTPACL